MDGSVVMAKIVRWWRDNNEPPVADDDDDVDDDSDGERRPVRGRARKALDARVAVVRKAAETNED